mmetsp:Transcript_1555/g.3462  ORF Transcript_1555/g.3462 Transcript_1555/m.3462 type:complete len:299 (-) Transcript_1555:2070-2966(-)
MRLAPCTASACATPIITLLKKQNPPGLSGSAWWPGGRAITNTLRTSVSRANTVSTAATVSPAARSAAASVPGEATVSASRLTGRRDWRTRLKAASRIARCALEWTREICSSVTSTSSSRTRSCSPKSASHEPRIASRRPERRSGLSGCGPSKPGSWPRQTSDVKRDTGWPPPPRAGAYEGLGLSSYAASICSVCSRVACASSARRTASCTRCSGSSAGGRCARFSSQRAVSCCFLAAHCARSARAPALVRRSMLGCQPLDCSFSTAAWESSARQISTSISSPGVARDPTLFARPSTDA